MALQKQITDKFGDVSGSTYITAISCVYMSTPSGKKAHVLLGVM